jgi:uncharacterized protein (DUF488 family)
MRQLYTIGHSNHSADAFGALLRRHQIEVIADVRSRPYSGRFGHFSRQPLHANLQAVGVRYVFLGRELGARRDEPECYVDAQARYDRIAALPAFKAGIERLLSGACDYRIALLCAEHDPLACHRTILVGRELAKHTVALRHICRDGAIEEHERAQARLIQEELGGAQQTDLFAAADAPSQRLNRAYDRRADRIAYRRDEQPPQAGRRVRS